MNNKKILSGTEARLREVRAGPLPSRMQTFVEMPSLTPESHPQLPPTPTARPSGDPSHSELKPKFSLWLYPTATPTAHLPDLISHHSPPLSAAVSYLICILPHQGLCPCHHLPPHPNIWSSHFLRSSGISSNISVTKKPSLTISYKCTILHLTLLFFLSTSYHQAYHIYTYFFI